MEPPNSLHEEHWSEVSRFYEPGATAKRLLWRGSRPSSRRNFGGLLTAETSGRNTVSKPLPW
jgi:hypothetical protein